MVNVGMGYHSGSAILDMELRYHYDRLWIVKPPCQAACSYLQYFSNMLVMLSNATARLR